MWNLSLNSWDPRANIYVNVKKFNKENKAAEGNYSNCIKIIKWWSHFSPRQSKPQGPRWRPQWLHHLQWLLPDPSWYSTSPDPCLRREKCSHLKTRRFGKNVWYTSEYLALVSDKAIYWPGEKRYEVVFRDNWRRKPASISIKIGT